MGEQEWEDCLLFITDPATGEQREIGAVKNIEWPEIQKASEESIRLRLKHLLSFSSVSYTHLTLPTICSV